MAVKSYQAQAEGEISLSKGEKIKGKGAGCSRAVGKGQQVNSPPSQGGARDQQLSSTWNFQGTLETSERPRCPFCLRGAYSGAQMRCQEAGSRQKRGDEHLWDIDPMRSHLAHRHPRRRVSGAHCTVEGTEPCTGEAACLRSPVRAHSSSRSLVQKVRDMLP